MSAPEIALAIGVVAVLIAGMMFWPQRGLLAKWRQIRIGTARAFLEDALKHLYDCEYTGISCTVHSVSGALGVDGGQSTDVIEKLESMGLVSSKEPSGLALTPNGRAYALRVIRIHRLWERYLADETGLEETDWHQEAENIEHRMTAAQANELAARMGNPIIDPHGDPIPNSTGEIKPLDGIPLSSLKPGEIAEIVHIEDEPKAAYAQLVAQRLHIGQQIRMIEIEQVRIRFEADGEECVLAPLLATHLTVRKIERNEEAQTSFRTLNTLADGEEAVVAGVSRACRGIQRRRLLDLGIVPGSSISAEIRGAGGDPVGYRIRGALVALRETQSKQIFIKEKDVINERYN
ncbi:hypothetical protein F9K33_01975 [bacterium]|nr:MAG: hypothetical protein F9K33_01975 [bacterium]